MRALRENVVPSWLLSRAVPRPRRATGAAKPPVRPILLYAFRIAAALVEGEPISAPILRDKFGVPWSSAKRMMHELEEAYEGRVVESFEPRAGRAGTRIRVLRWRAA